VKIFASVSPGEIRVAAIDASGLVDYALWRPGNPDGVGDLYRGRITARMPALGGAFVTLGTAEGFLPERDGGDANPGTVLGVQVVRSAQGGKGVRLTGRLAADDFGLIGSGPPSLLRRGPGAVETLAVRHQGAEISIDDAGLAATLRPLFGNRLRIVPQAFDAALEADIAALGSPDIDLADGARMSIYPTPALTAIDLDLAGASAARTSKGAAHSAINRAAIPALARQIRLRNLAGGIVIDFAGLSVKARASLGPAIISALADDPQRARFLGFSALGLAEILRPRVHPPLHELLGTPYAEGLAALRQAAAESAANPAVALELTAAPALITALRADPGALAQFTARAGRSLALREDRLLPISAWRRRPLPRGPA
jgi:ribonuclease G